MEQKKIIEQRLSRVFSEINYAMEQAKKREKFLKEDLSLVDLEVVDIQHYIEIKNFSASEGYKTLMMLKDCLERRRIIKMEKAIVTSTIMVIENGMNPDRIDALIEKQDLRYYKPRVLDELFEK